MSLVDRLESTGERSFAVVGLAKNCGKTTVVNHLIGEWGRRGVRLGLTSIGRDGEPVDLVTRLPKPRIRVEPGTLAVTAEASLADSAAPSRIVRRMGIPSALGELLLVETEGAGLIELSGPSTMDQAREVISLLRESGAERVVLDGALDRLSCGAPSVCGAAVLSCGAVLGSSPETIAEKAAHQVKLFRLPVLVGEGAEVVRRVAASRGRLAAAIDADGNVTPLDGSALTCRGLADALPEGCRWLWAGGGITDSIAGALLKRSGVPDIVAGDATRVFLSPMTLDRLRMAGARVWVLAPVRLAAIATNPVRPAGAPLDARLLLDCVARAVPAAAVYDVVVGLASECGLIDGCEKCARLAS